MLLITDTQRPGKPRSANGIYIKTVFPTIIDLGKDVLLGQLVSEAGRLVRYLCQNQLIRIANSDKHNILGAALLPVLILVSDR